MHAKQKAVVHDVQPFQQFAVRTQLRCQTGRVALIQLVGVIQVQVFQDLLCRVIRRARQPPKRGALQVVAAVDGVPRAQQVAHHDKADVAAAVRLHTMQPEETCEHRVRVLDHVGVIIAQHRAAKMRLRLCVSDTWRDMSAC